MFNKRRNRINLNFKELQDSLQGPVKITWQVLLRQENLDLVALGVLVVGEANTSALTLVQRLQGMYP